METIAKQWSLSAKILSVFHKGVTIQCTGRILECKEELRNPAKRQHAVKLLLRRQGRLAVSEAKTSHTGAWFPHPDSLTVTEK
jgi:hypothetical protein